MLAWLRAVFQPVLFYSLGLVTLLGKVGMGLITALGQSNRTLEPCSVHGVCLGFVLASSSCCSLVLQGAGLLRAMETRGNLRGYRYLWL